MNASTLFGRDKALIGMIHVGALPGTPRCTEDVGALARRAVEEARLLADAGFDALILENMHDRPFLRREVGPEIVAAMTRIGSAVRETVGPDLALGVQILAGANRAALAVAHAIGAQFIRAEGFVFAAVSDEGLLEEADAGPLLRYRRTIGAESVRILADVKKKHSAHAITADVSLGETAVAAEFAGADGVIITGPATGHPTDPDDLKVVRGSVSIPVIAGSGATPKTLGGLWKHAHAIIIGSWYKRDGRWDEEPDLQRVSRLMSEAMRVRGRLRNDL